MNSFEEKIKNWLGRGFKLFLIILPWSALYLVRIGSTSFDSVVIHLTAVLLLGIIGTALFLFRPKFNYWLLGFIGLFFLLGIFQAEDWVLALQQIIWLSLGAGLGWLFTTDLLSKTEQIKFIVIGAILPTLLGLWQFFVQSSFTSAWLGLSFIPSSAAGSPVIVSQSGRWLRAFGTLPHPNIFGGYLVAILALIFARASESVKSSQENWLWRLAVVFFTAGLVVSFSRSALLAWILLVVFYHYRVFKNEHGSELALQIFISSLTAILALTLTWSIWVGRLGQEVASQNEVASISERLSGNRLAIKIIKGDWLSGVGPGNYVLALHRVAPALKPWELTPVHNVPLLVLAEWGIWGIVALVWLGYFLRARVIFLLPILLFDHYFYSLWPGILVGIILILSTVYTHRGLTKPKK